MRGIRLIVGIAVMAVGLPLALFFLLPLHDASQLLIVSLAALFCWGVADLFAKLLEQPRLADRSPQGALQDWRNKS